MSPQIKEATNKITIGIIATILSILGTIAVYSFKGGGQNEKVERHEIRIERLNTEKLNKEIFENFRRDIKEDIRELKLEQKEGFQMILDRIDKKRM